MSYVHQGKIPPKRHTIFKSEEGNFYYEQLFGTEGFPGISSLLCIWKDVCKIILYFCYKCFLLRVQCQHFISNIIYKSKHITMIFKFFTLKTALSFSLMMFVNFSLFAQMKISFDNETVKKLEVNLFPVEQKIIPDSSGVRTTYTVLTDIEIPIFADELNGQFTIISDKMGFSDETVPGQFVKNELSEKVNKYYEINESTISLIENEKTKKLYVINSYIIKNLNRELEKNLKDGLNQKMIIEFLKSIGYVTYKENGNLYVKTKYYRVLCNLSTYNVLKKDQNYIRKIDVWFEQRQIIRKKMIATIPKFENYVRIYKIQRNRMSKPDISSWTALTKSATLLNKSEVDFTDKLWGLIELGDFTKNFNKYSNTFIEYLGASTGALGL